MAINGEPVFSASSITLSTFLACSAPTEPPLTVKSLRVDVDRLFVDQAVARDDAGVLIEHIQFDKTRRIQQQRHALARQQLPGLFLLGAKGRDRL